MISRFYFSIFPVILNDINDLVMGEKLKIVKNMIEQLWWISVANVEIFLVQIPKQWFDVTSGISECLQLTVKYATLISHFMIVIQINNKIV